MKISYGYLRLHVKRNTLQTPEVCVFRGLCIHNSDDLNVPQQAHDLGIKRLGLLTISESQLTKLKSLLGVT